MFDPLPPDWYKEPDEAVVQLLRDLEERGEIHTAQDAIDVAAKPWKYTPEMRRLLRERELSEAA